MDRSLLTWTFVWLTVSAGLSSSAYAASYGEAGCGPGSVVITKNSLFSQMTARGINVILFPLHATAITFATSNCDATWSRYRPEERERLEFIAANYWSLKSDVARGQGETLVAFQELHGCALEQQATVLPQVQALLATDFDAEGIATQSRKISQYCRGES